MLLIGILTNAQKPRARDLGVPFDGTPGNLNAITDVKGVKLGIALSFQETVKILLGKVL